MKSLSAATVWAAILGFVVILIPPRTLDPTSVESFLIYWSLFFTLTGVLDGLTLETTRAVATSSSETEHHTYAPSTRLLWRKPVVAATLTIGVPLALLVLITAFWWSPQVSSTVSPLSSGLLLAVGVISYAFQAAFMGLLSARTEWKNLAALITSDATLRLILALVAWWAGWPLIAFFCVTIVGAFSWLILYCVLRGDRKIFSHAVDSSPREFLAKILQAIATTGLTALLITGFPFLLHITNPGAASIAALTYGITLTRAPLLVPLQRFQPALVVQVINRTGRLWDALRKPALLLLGVSLLGALAAWLVGPFLMRVIIGEEYVLSGGLLAGLTFAAGFTAALLFSGTVTLAYNLHRQALVGWVATLVIAIGILCIPSSILSGVEHTDPTSLKAILALIIGPLVGMAWHISAILRTPAQDTPTPQHEAVLTEAEVEGTDES